LIKVSTLKKNPGNPRQIKGDKLDKLKASVGGFQKMMALRPMIVDENNVVLGGNMRLAAIKALGLKEIPDDWVKQVTDLTPDEKAEFVIKDNNSFGEYDWDAIANEWSEYPLADWGLDVPGFEVVEEVGEADAEPQIDKAAELNKKWGVVSGDLWQIGEHRLLCGDSTNVQHIDALMNGEKAQMVFTDPPYGMNLNTEYARSNRVFGNSYEPVIGDDKEFDPSLLFQMFEYIDEQFWWGADYYCQRIPAGGSWVVWDKKKEDLDESIGTGFELCWSKLPHKRMLARFLWSGFTAKERDSARIHPTQKPVALVQWFFERWGAMGDIVLDFFAGSGTTLVACQNLNRKCYAIEISENYCAVILERMATAFPDIEIKRIEDAKGKATN